MRFRLDLLSLSLCVFGLSTACDLEIRSGDTVVLSNDGFVLGSFPERGEASATPAARLHPGGTLVVEDASLLGGNVRLSSLDFVPSPAPAIVATGGVLRIQKGLIRGGELALTRSLSRSFAGTDAITASETRIEVTGGTIAGGPAAEFVPEPLSETRPTGGAAISARNSHLQITGGVFRPGPAQREAVFGGTGSSAFLSSSTFDIRGGDFRAGLVSLRDTRGVIAGGRFNGIDVIQARGSCLEIRGGSLATLLVANGTHDVFVFGTGFSEPEGTIDSRVQLTGTLEDGSALDLDVVVSEGSSITLARAGTRGCL